ncbi:RcnB family protein [Rhodanobacter sp. Col0626]|uniref:RcnB family protein n=1 Tax=Rhodanobacter sp. Col0626 TaxID=3415679 RepID=UPI003CF54F9D
MKRQWVAWALSSALLMSSTAAVVAQPAPQNRHDQDRHDQDHHNNNHHDQHQHGMYERGHSEGWYRKGGHVPQEYRGGTYVVSDWHARHLHQPPRGYHYVRSDNGDILLVAITTGIIASILAQH